MQQFTLKTHWSTLLLVLAMMMSEGVRGQVSYVNNMSGNWSNTTIWTPNGTPGANDNVTITAGHTITIDNDFTISSLVIDGTLEFDATVRAIVVNGDINISNSGTFRTQPSGTASHSLLISGDFKNSNVLDFSRGGTTAVCDVTFIKNGNQLIAGTGEMTRFNSIVLNMGSTNLNVLEVTAENFSASNSFLTIMNGTFKLTSNVTVNASTGNMDISVSGGLWVNGGTINIGSSNGSLSLYGLLRMDAGVLNVGNTTGNQIDNRGVVTVSNGTINLSGRWRQTGGGEAVITGGIMNISTTGQTSTGSVATFQVPSSNPFSMSGGEIILHNANSNLTGGDLKITNSSAVITGGKITIGQGLGTNGNISIESSVPLFNLTIDAGSSFPYLKDNLTVNNDLQIISGTIEIHASRYLTVNGTLTNNAGASGLVIGSDATGTGSLITSGAVTGQITVQRYITGASEDWHLVSSPVSSQGISGDWTPAGNYPDATGYDFYAWHEDGQIWVNRKNTTASPNGDAPRFDDVAVNGGTNFNPARGYMTAYQASNPTKTFAGEPFNASQTYTLSRSGVGSNAGLNLVGNPFPATIAGNSDADGTNNFLTANAAVLDDAFEAYYYWNTPTDDYVAVNQSSGAHFIEVGQGFFVVASADNAVLNFNTNLRKHGAATFYKNTIDRKALQLVVNTESGKLNQTELVFDPSMSIGLDPGYDAAKIQGNTSLSLYSLLPVPHERVFDIQSLPIPSQEMIVPIGITVDQSGVYHLSLNPTEAFEGSIIASLYDKETNTQLQIDGNTSYSFNVGEAGVYNQRFEIHFGALSIDDNPSQSPASAYVHAGQLYILNGNGMTDIRIVDVQGRLLQSFRQNVEGLFSTRFDLPAGMYIIQLQDAQGVRSNKVIKQ